MAISPTRYFANVNPRFASAERHKPASEADPEQPFRPEDFQVAADHSFCICPAGNRLYRNGAHVVINGYAGVKFQGAQRDCGPCALRHRCLKHPSRTPTRQFVFFQGRAPGKPETYSARMKRKIDTEQGRYQYGRRLGTVEPVFANLCSAHKLKHFGLRGKRKVNTQWLLYCLVHNIEKLAHSGYTR